MSTSTPSKTRHKSTGRAKPIVKGDVVLLSHKRIGVVRYVGDIAEYIENGIWYGIEIRMTAGVLGDSNGIIGTTTYFKCATNEGLFVGLHDIQRRIEPKELLEKVVKLTKIKNSMHQLLNQTHNELTTLKTKFNISTHSSSSASSKYDYKYKSKKKRRKHSTHNNSDSNSIIYEPSISISDSNDFSAQHAPIQVAKPLKARNSNVSQTQIAQIKQIKQWNTSKSTHWIKSFADFDNHNNNHNNEWLNVINKMEENNVNGNDLLLMNETNLLTKVLQINSSKIKSKIVNEFDNILKSKNNCGHGSYIPSLQHSSSSPAKTIHAKVNTLKYKQSNATFGQLSEFNSMDEIKDNMTRQSFNELYTFFNKMNTNNNGKVDLSEFRYILIEIDPDLEPYKLTNACIQKCFDEFDLCKNTYFKIEEFIAVMGKTYLRGLSKSKSKSKSNHKQLTQLDIKTYFIQIIKHFIKKGQKNINYNGTRKQSVSRSRTMSGSKPPAPPRKGSVSRSRSAKPPPPKRDASPSQCSQTHSD